MQYSADTTAVPLNYPSRDFSPESDCIVVEPDGFRPLSTLPSFGNQFVNTHILPWSSGTSSIQPKPMQPHIPSPQARVDELSNLSEADCYNAENESSRVTNSTQPLDLCDEMDDEIEIIEPPQRVRPTNLPTTQQTNFLGADMIAEAATVNASRDASPLTSQLGIISPSKRTKEEILARRLQAQAKRQEAIAAANDPLARETKKWALQRDREERGAKALGQYGFKITPGISRFGSGRGRRNTSPMLDSNGQTTEHFSLTSGPLIWVDDPRCSAEQLEVLRRVRAGENVFFTGSAGVGKSFLLHEVTRLLEFEKKDFYVTAPTGIAALQIHGITLHSFAGVGLAQECVIELLNKILNKKQSKEKWLQTRVLIIDEISMVDPEFFTKLSIIAKLIRENPKPFGGMQLILCGDFFQLPPVANKSPKCIRCGQICLEEISLHDSTLPYEETPPGLKPASIFRCSDKMEGALKTILGCGLEFRRRKFVFETEIWREMNFQTVELTKIFRQSDSKYIQTLEKFRRGNCDQECIDFLNSCGTGLSKGGKNAIKPTSLNPHKASVDRENEFEFKALGDVPCFTFQADDTTTGPRAHFEMKQRLNDVPAAARLQLKTGAQVLLLANLDQKAGLVNGSRGVIVDWAPAKELSEVDSDVRDGDDWKREAIEKFSAKQTEEFFPIVVFASGVTKTIRAHCWVIDLDKENSIARTQIPLALAFSLTIHKSQGQSLDAVAVKLNKTFENGMAYVALSRCRTPAGMKVQDFKPST